MAANRVIEDYRRNLGRSLGQLLSPRESPPSRPSAVGPPAGLPAPAGGSRAGRPLVVGSYAVSGLSVALVVVLMAAVWSRR